jgi:hypothetical protein
MHGSGTLDYLDHLILPNLAVPRHFMTCGRVDGPVGRWAALMTHVFFHVFPIYNKCSLAGNFCSDLFVQSMGLVPLFIPPFKQADYKGTMKKIKLRYCGIIFHASEEKKQCFPMGFHINLDPVAFQAAANSTKTNRTMLDSARDLYVRSSMSEIDYQAAVTGHRWQSYERK